MTSEIIKQGIKFIKEKKQQGFDIKIPRKSSLYEDNFNVSEVFETKTADIMEDNGVLKIKNVEISSEKSCFSFFLDGIERKKVLFYYRSIPVIYGYTSAVILQRIDKKLRSINFEDSLEKFYLPIKHKNSDSPEHYLAEEEISALKEKISDIGQIKNADGNYRMLPEQFIQAAHSSIQTDRGEIEKKLARKWIESSYSKNDWLFVDGRLENKNKELISGAKIVGIIKSHHASYFNYEDQYKIYSMKKGERSGVFQPKDEKGARENIYSWYLKIHSDKKYGDNNFGLIRVEVPAEKEFLEKADLISSWILLETKPVAFPASRWDRMIYPVKYCEDYLKSKAPTRIMIDSLN